MSDDDSPAKPGRFPLPASAVAQSRVRFFERSDWLSFWLTTGLTLAVYMVTMTPHITLGDSGMFSVGAMYAGVPHPPGYPLWTLYGWLFIKLLPVSGVAWRLAVASAVAGALASGVISLMVSRLGIQIAALLPNFNFLTRKESNLLCVGSGCVAGTVFGFNGAFWNAAVQVHVWPLSILMLCCVICLLLRWSYEPERKRYLYSACLLYGLTLTNSQIMLAVAPALPFLLLAGSLRVASDGFLTGSLLFMAGLAARLMGFSQ